MTTIPPYNPINLDDQRRTLLAAMYEHVPFEGWSDGVLVMAADDVGMEVSEAKLLFPGGAPDIVDFYLAEGDRLMAETLAQRELSNMRVRDRITLAVRTRIEPEIISPEVLRRTATWLSLPQNNFMALRAGYRTVDAMWAAVGDGSADFNFYTKRALLFGVHSATVLYAIGDKSEGHQETWTFLDRRIADVMKVQKARGDLDDFLGQILRTVGIK